MRIYLALLLLASGALQANTTFDLQESVTKWIAFCYQNPEPSLIPAAVRYMSESGMLEKNGVIPPVIGFLDGAFKNNPENVSDWLDQTQGLEESHLGVVVLGPWYANLPVSQAESYALLDQYPGLKRKSSFLPTGAPMAVEQIPLGQGPWVQDALWGNFMATGSKVPVLRIAEALPWAEVKGDTGRLVVDGAARWSLASNAVQHQRVLVICERSVSEQPAEVATKLLEVIATAKADLEDKKNKETRPST